MNCSHCNKPIAIPADAPHKHFCAPSDHLRRREPIARPSCRAAFHTERRKRALALMLRSEQEVDKPRL